MADTAGSTSRQPDSRRWFALVVIALAQLMVILDATIVNIALPSAAKDLDISVANRQWVVTAYTIAFGGLLLLGGRIADYAGRKRTFMVGLIGFAAASAAGGAATGFPMLLAARAVQGAFGALLAPSALSLLAVTFSDPKERGRAFGVYGAIAASGSAVGLLLGGVLTDYLNWTWCLYVNAPIALIAFLAAIPALRNTRSTERNRYDIIGALFATGGLVCLVYGFTKAETDGWRAHVTLGLIIGGVLLLILFVITEALVRNPLLPLRIPAHRTRGGAYLSVMLAIVGMFALFFFLNFYLQGVKHFSPVRTGVAFLPMTGGVLVTSALASRLMSRVPPRFLIGPGLLIAAGGMLFLTRLRPETTYTSHVLPALIIVGLGLGLVMVTSVNAATSGVDPRDAGVASATVNTAQQVGGSLGTALLNTIAANATADYLLDHPAPGRAAAAVVKVEGTVHGYNVASAYGAAILAGAGILALLLISARRLGVTEPAPVGDAEPAAPESAVPEPIAADPIAPQAEAEAEPAPAAAVPEPEPPTVTGTVRHHDGRRVANASVTLIDPAGRQVGRSGTGSDGDFTLRAPEPGSFVLVTAARGLQPQAQALSLDGEPVAVEVTVSGSGGLSGIVTAGARRTGVPGATITLTDDSGAVLAATRTDERGRYELADLGAGGYTLVTSAAGFGPTAGLVTVPTGDQVRHDVELVGGAVVRGNVTTAGEHRPIGSARVTLLDSFGTVVAATTTAADGGYEFGGLPGDDYTIVASGYPPVSCRITLDVADSHEQDILLRHPD
ncbi:MAG TPA: MFS transporter [Mycobacteriales bacterium]|nr:MFS transporter [Mycobacteriales bacterium]